MRRWSAAIDGYGDIPKYDFSRASELAAKLTALGFDKEAAELAEIASFLEILQVRASYHLSYDDFTFTRDAI